MNTMNYEQVVNFILNKLQFYYTNLQIVSALSDVCFQLEFAENEKVITIPFFSGSIKCYVSLNGYDEEVRRYELIEDYPY